MGAAQPKPRQRVVERRRKLGAFYTPRALSDLLSAWAIRQGSETVLEPSFGGCGFIQSANETLLRIGNRNPLEQIYGCDIDPGAFKHLAKMLGRPVDLKRFVLGDFLNVTAPPGWPKTFDVILANPPYIPYQKLSRKHRTQLLHQATRIPLSGRASLWAYFIGHALNYLAEGGRVALVLPGAILQTYYAKPIREYFGLNFHRSAAIVIRDRIFLEEGTDEETVVLLAEGHRSPDASGQIALSDVQSIEDLAKTLSEWNQAEVNNGKPVVSEAPAHLSLSPALRELFHQISSNQHNSVIGSCANVKIGIVTGANNFFVLPRAKLKQNNLHIPDCIKVLGKFKGAPGLTFEETDHSAFMKEGGCGYLVDGSKLPNKRLSNYFRKFPKERRDTVQTFKKRSKWHSPNDTKIPDAFFPVMHHTGPRIALNAARHNCTNTIHRVYFKDGFNAQTLLAVSILTSYSQISAEIVGRRYGSGVLKHEPREAEKIAILLPSIPEGELKTAFTKIDDLIRRQMLQEATKLADEIVYQYAGIADWEHVSSELNSALSLIRARRKPKRDRASTTSNVQPR